MVAPCCRRCSSTELKMPCLVHQLLRAVEAYEVAHGQVRARGQSNADPDGRSVCIRSRSSNARD
jgi:hypothetical protein